MLVSVAVSSIQGVPPRRVFHDMTALKRTSLFDLHKRLGAKVAPFCGYEMPIQYPAMGVLKEHHHTRKHAGLFDVSHMGQVVFTGKDRDSFLKWVMPVDLDAMKPGQARLSMLTNENGGIIDDCILTRYQDHNFLVINAGCKDKDLAHLRKKLEEFSGDVKMEVLDKSLVALQGPSAMKVLGEHVNDLNRLPFMTGLLNQKIKDLPVLITRCGYTGEDGFEISVSHDQAEKLADILLANKEVQMIGLGARDSLRLEAGMCLYGHELNEQVNPVAARLMWCISKSRMENGGFIGYEKIKEFRAKQPELVPEVRVGIVSQGPVARENTPIQLDGAQIGTVTSGCPSPTLGKNIAMGYVKRELANKGQKVQLNVRSKLIEGEVVTLPFVQPNYYKM